MISSFGTLTRFRSRPRQSHSGVSKNSCDRLSRQPLLYRSTICVEPHKSLEGFIFHALLSNRCIIDESWLVFSRLRRGNIGDLPGVWEGMPIYFHKAFILCARGKRSRDLRPCALVRPIESAWSREPLRRRAKNDHRQARHCRPRQSTHC